MTSFALRKLHSLFGVIPVGVFLLWHLFANSVALSGPQAYDRLVETMRHLPYLPAIEALFIYLPLGLHALYGLFATFRARNNLGSYPYLRNFYFLLQRVTGLITFAFLGYHIYLFRLSELFGRERVSFELVRESLQSPPVLAFHLVGVVSAAFHLANGLWLFAVNWGLVPGPRAQRQLTRALELFFVLLSAVGLNALRAFLR